MGVLKSMHFSEFTQMLIVVDCFVFSVYHLIVLAVVFDSVLIQIPVNVQDLYVRVGSNTFCKHQNEHQGQN